MAKKVYLKGEEFVFSRVKGNKESTYRDGDINLTPANIGASAEGHTHDDRYYTESEINTKLNDKANSSHTHGNSDITGIDGSKITTGTIDLARLPQGALERLTVVADDTVRFKLTSSTIQKGDTVKVTSTGKMYYVVDETKLSTEAGYEVYATGTAASVPWSGVTGKPGTYTPSSHTHDDRYYTETEIDTKLKTKSNMNTYISNNGEGISIAPTRLITPDGLQRINYTLDILPATSETIGGVKVGNTLTIDNGILNAKQIGIEGADTESCITTFVSDDSSTGSSTAPAVITSGETHKSLFNKISTAVKNVRWLLSKMGTTDISSLGDGTVTGALSTLNSNLSNHTHDDRYFRFVRKYIELSIQASQLSEWWGVYYYDFDATAYGIPSNAIFVAGATCYVRGNVCLEVARHQADTSVRLIFSKQNNVSLGLSLFYYLT